jgi:hypothetical protein
LERKFAAKANEILLCSLKIKNYAHFGLTTLGRFLWNLWFVTIPVDGATGMKITQSGTAVES